MSPTPSEKSERSCSLENFGGATSLLVASSSKRVLNNEVKFMRQEGYKIQINSDQASQSQSIIEPECVQGLVDPEEKRLLCFARLILSF